MKKEKTGKLLKGFVMMCFSIILLSTLHTKQIKAANIGIYTIEQNKEYKNYDITGDGKKDTILIQGTCTSGNEDEPYNVLKVIINGKTALTRKNVYFYHANTQLILAENHIYFFISLPLDNDDGPEDIYEFADGKLKKRADVNHLISKATFHNSSTVTKVTKNKITIKAISQSDALASTQFSITYKIDKQGKLTLSPKTYKVKYSNKRYDSNTDKVYTAKYLVARKNIQIYKKANTNKKAFLLKKGQRIKVYKIYLGGKKAMYYCKTKSGKTGWFVSKFNLFKDLMYAG